MHSVLTMLSADCKLAERGRLGIDRCGAYFPDWAVHRQLANWRFKRLPVSLTFQRMRAFAFAGWIMKHRHLLGALLMLGGLALGRTALADTLSPAPLYADEEILNEKAGRCHNAVKFGLALFRVAPGQQDSGGFQLGANSTVTIAAWCLPQDANHIYLVIAVASTDIGAAEDARNQFRDEVKGYLNNPLNQ